MDDEDTGDAWHQMELEQRQREEEALARGRKVLAEFRESNAQFETEMKALNERVRKQLCKAL